MEPPRIGHYREYTGGGGGGGSTTVEYVLQFARHDDLQYNGFNPAIENRRIVSTCSFDAGGSKVEGSISYNYRFHIVTRFKS